MNEANYLAVWVRTKDHSTHFVHTRASTTDIVLVVHYSGRAHIRHTHTHKLKPPTDNTRLAPHNAAPFQDGSQNHVAFAFNALACAAFFCSSSYCCASASASCIAHTLAVCSSSATTYSWQHRRYASSSAKCHM